MLRLYLQITIFWTTFFLTLSHGMEGFNAQLPPVLDNPTNCGLGLPINDFSCDASHEFKLNVLSAPGISLGQDVFLREVRLIIRHEWDADLDIYLISPTGVEVELSTDNGSGNDNYGNPDSGLCDEYTAFISHALANSCDAISIEDGSAPFIGEFLPEESLGKFNDHSSPIGLWTLRICDDGKEHYGTFEFAELIFEATDCLPPTQVSLRLVDSTFAVLDWVPGSNCDSTLIEYGPKGFSPGAFGTSGGGILISAGCPPFQINGLLPSYDYNFYIREKCEGGFFSKNSCVAEGMTQCSPPPATIVENFNDEELCEPVCGALCPLTGAWLNASNDHFDWLVNSGPTSTTQTGPEDDFPGGGNYVYVETSGTLCQNGNTAYLVSKCIEVHAGPDSCDMSFDYFMYGVHVNGLALEATTDGGDSWQTLWQASGNQGNVWRKKYVNLDTVDGKTAQFRFVGKGGNGIRGDIAIDNIVFYGSELSTEPSYTYYRDLDGDGYGDPKNYITTCQPLIPPPFGYVTNDGDCNDFDDNIHPDAFEIPCDGIDSNCNGDDDEYTLLPVFTLGDTICNNGEAFLLAQGFSGGGIFWFDAPEDGNLLNVGNLFIPQNLPLNTTPQPLELKFYVEEIIGESCVAEGRDTVSLVILPTPQLATAATPSGCLGEPFDLTTLDLTDEHGVNGQLSYRDASWNEINPIIYPPASSEYFIVSDSQQGCSDTLRISYIVEPAPVSVIAGDSTLCRGQAAVLTALDIGAGVAPLTFNWNFSNQTNASIQVTNNLPIGQSATYSVTVTGGNGCSDTASVTVESVTSIDAVQTSTSPESFCDGADGEIILTPIGGVPPFNYTWAGGGAIGEPGSLHLTGLSKGTYSFTVTDSGTEGCDFVVPVVVVDGPSTVTTIENIIPVSCNGNNDGCIEIGVLGSNPSILWNTGDTTELVCGLAAGNYEVTISDGNCENVLSIPMPEPTEPLFAKQSIQSVSCYGHSNGAIQLTVFGGTPPYQFQWSNGKNTQNIESLPEGEYAVTVTDARGCSYFLENLVVFQPLELAISATALAPPSCYGFQNGEISVQPQGGVSPYSLVWDNGAVGTTLTNLAAGSYSVTMTDARGCTQSQNIQLTQPAALVVSVEQAIAPVCNGLNTGSIDISVNGGNGGYSYSWNNGAIVQDLENIGSGQYQVVVTDQKNCVQSSPWIDLPGPEFMEMAFGVVNPPCVGRDEGVISAQVINGGVPPYSYYWSTDDSSPILEFLPGGEYTVTVVDGNGCQYDTTLMLLADQPISVDIDTFHLTCFKNESGSLNLTVLGGTAPFDIAWSTSEHGSYISGLSSANYQATITDDQGCKFFTEPIFLEQPEELAILLDYAEGSPCQEDAEGSIQVSVSGGTGNYAYLWSNGKQTRDIVGLPQGDYTLTVTDGNGCVKELGPIQIVNPLPLYVSHNIPAPEGCLPFQVDSVCLSVSGGTIPYSFLWNTGDTAACLQQVASGDYQATVTDAMGCTAELMSVKVLEEFFPVKVTALSTGLQKICAGTNEGAVAVLIEKGIAPYQYIWSNGVSGQTYLDTIHLDYLEPGAYDVTITDQVGCTAASPVMAVTTDGYILPSIPGSQIHHVNCKYGTNGSLAVNVIGGKAPYSYSWTNEDGEEIGGAAAIHDLVAGIYQVLITDQNGCTGSIGAQIIEPDLPLSLTDIAPITTHISCFGADDGAINLTPYGGIPPYTFSWSNGETTEDISGLGSGTYIATVTDSNLCVLISQGIEIISPEGPLQLSMADITSVSCYNGSDGSIDVAISGGTPPYVYTWGTIANTEDLEGVPSGTYPLVVSDSNLLCTLDTFFFIPQPNPLEISFEVTPSSTDLPLGAIVVSAFGGVAPYIYEWNTGAVGDTISGVPAGLYQLTITDANLCDTIIWITIPVKPNGVFESESGGSFLVYPNPNGGQFQLELSLPLSAQAEIRVFNAVGQSVFSKKEEHAKEEKWKVNLADQPPGMYFAIVWLNSRAAFRTKIIIL